MIDINEKRNKRVKKVFIGVLAISILCFFININKNINVDDNPKDKSIKADKSSETDMMQNLTSSTNKNKDDEYLLLVNKNNPLKANYKPKDMVMPSIRFDTVADNMVQYVRKDVATALDELFKEAKKDGIDLIAVSGFRSYDYQYTLYRNKVRRDGKLEASKYVAKAGQSEHQTGLAMDVLSNNYKDLDAGFENTEAFKWLQDNMSRFGFILRFPKGKEDITGYNYEPWHIRYVGVEAATKIMEKGLTLEEYLNK